MMIISGLMAAPLSDGRLQVWASKHGKLFTLWKTGVRSDSGWTNWAEQPASTLGVTVGAAAPLPNRALNLFVLANAGFNPPYQTGPGVEMTYKVGAESTAQWAEWRTFVEGEQALHGGAGAVSVAAVPLSDGRLQVFVAMTGSNSAKLLTRWKVTADPYGPWTSPSLMPFPPGESIASIGGSFLSDGRVQLFATTSGTNVYTTWKIGRESTAPWQPWQLFYQGSDDDRIIAAPLSDGRLQLWRTNRSGAIWSRWKASTDSSAAWTEWQVFNSPASVGPVAFAAAPLSDGRLQLFLADSNDRMFSSWKVNTNPNSAWTPWSPFAAP